MLWRKTLRGVKRATLFIKDKTEPHKNEKLFSIVTRVIQGSYGSCSTNFFKMGVYAVAGSILVGGSMRLECFVRTDWRWLRISQPYNV